MRCHPLLEPRRSAKRSAKPSSTHPADKSGRTKRKTGISAPVWPSGLVSASIQRLSAAASPDLSDPGCPERSGGCCHVFRSGIVIQADLLISCITHYWQGSFAPPRVTQVHHDYDPLRLLTRHVGGYAFPPPFRGHCTRRESQPSQVSQVPDVSFGARCPLSPRRVRLLPFVALQTVTGFTLFGRLATLAFVTRPKRVHAFALRLTPSLTGASYRGSLHATPDSLHGERTISMISSFQLTRDDKLP